MNWFNIETKKGEIININTDNIVGLIVKPNKIILKDLIKLRDSYQNKKRPYKCLGESKYDISDISYDHPAYNFYSVDIDIFEGDFQHYIEIHTRGLGKNSKFDSRFFPTRSQAQRMVESILFR